MPSPALGSETSVPGGDQRRRPWPPRAHRGRSYTEAFPRGHRSCLLYFSFLFIWQAVLPLPHGCRWISYSLLGRAPFIPGFPLPHPFGAAVFASQGPVSHHRRGFLKTFKLLVDPAASRLVDTVSTQLLPTVSSMRSQPEPAETSATAAATPAGRATQAQVHDQGSAPAPHPGCSQSGQPNRAVTTTLTSLLGIPGSSLCLRDPWAASSWTSSQRSPKRPRCCRPCHMHFIATKGPPIASKFRRLDAEKLQAANVLSSWATRCQPPGSSPCAATCRQCLPTLSPPTSANCKLSWAPSTSTAVSSQRRPGSSSLKDLLIGGLKGTEPVSLADSQRAAFVAAKDALAAAMCLAHPSQGFQLSLMVDASADHIDGALQQRQRPADPWQPLGFSPGSWTAHK